jgi:hypothetical protein
MFSFVEHHLLFLHSILKFLDIFIQEINSATHAVATEVSFVKTLVLLIIPGYIKTKKLPLPEIIK